MSNLYDDRVLMNEANHYLDELQGSGVTDIDAMTRSLRVVFFTEEWEAFFLIRNWIASAELKNTKEGVQ